MLYAAFLAAQPAKQSSNRGAMMSTGAQVLKFVIADFDQNWSRSVAVEGFIVYTATASQSHLAVVHEGRRGALTTYRYRVPANEAVWIVDDVIHTPERCIRQERGNTVKCGK
jgi:hypothetical protein